MRAGDVTTSTKERPQPCRMPSSTQIWSTPQAGKIHDGRKRIDISFTNAAQTGFFWWVGDHFPAANIVIECKNYSRPIANPEYDQIAGRFSPSRGRLASWLIAITRKNKVVDSCRDIVHDDRGFIIGWTTAICPNLSRRPRLATQPRSRDYSETAFASSRPDTA